MVRADKIHERLLALGFAGNERTTRREVAEAKAAYAAGHRRRYRPWVPEPGMWLQFDWGEGPRITGRRTNLFCAWVAWSRFRVVIPTWDRTLGPRPSPARGSSRWRDHHTQHHLSAHRDFCCP